MPQTTRRDHAGAPRKRPGKTVRLASAAAIGLGLAVGAGAIASAATSSGSSSRVASPSGLGAQGDPPADGGTPPANGGTPPANGGTPPANSGTPPANGGTPPVAVGTVASVASDSFTLTTAGGSTVTVDVSSTTTYMDRDVTSPTFADVTVGESIGVMGTETSGTVTAMSVCIGVPGAPGGSGRTGGPGSGPAAPAVAS